MKLFNKKYFAVKKIFSLSFDTLFVFDTKSSEKILDFCSFLSYNISVGIGRVNVPYTYYK